MATIGKIYVKLNSFDKTKMSTHFTAEICFNSETGLEIIVVRATRDVSVEEPMTDGL